MKKPRVRKHEAAGDISPAEPAPAPERLLRPFLVIVAVALLARMIAAPYFYSPENNPLFDPTVFRDGDLFENLEQAKEVLENGGRPEGYFIHGPLYVYIVAFSLWITGEYWPVYVLQALVGALTAGLVFLFSARLLSLRAGVAAGLLYALFAPAIYYETLLSSDSMIPFFISLMLYLGVVYEQQKQSASRFRIPIVIGIALGALTLLRANLCLLGLAIAAWFLFGKNQRSPRIRIAAVAIVAAVSILIITPAIVYNSAQAGAPRFTVGESEIIWKFSWSEDSPGYFYYPSPESELLSPLSPAAWKLAATKIYQYFSWFEFPDLTNYHLYSKLSPPLDSSPMTMRLLGPLALLGMVFAALELRRFLSLFSFLAIVVFAAVLFYISGRYRLAVVPLLAGFAGLSIDRLLPASFNLKSAGDLSVRWAWSIPLLFVFAFAVNRLDPAKLHSMWHGDATFGNFYYREARKANESQNWKRLELCGRRLLWILSPDYQIRGHEVLSVALDRQGDSSRAKQHYDTTNALMKSRLAEPSVDHMENRFFPPTH